LVSQEEPDGSTLGVRLAEVRERMAADEAMRKKYPTSALRTPSVQQLWEQYDLHSIRRRRSAVGDPHFAE
jgi:hypothetical protein